jgi:Zn-dependent protease
MNWPAPAAALRSPTGSMRPSPIFLGLCAAFVAACVWAATADPTAQITLDLVNQLPVFAVVLLGWVLSLCLHEYAHAIVAYHGGDRSVIERGYLTLDPRHYTSLGLSLLFPILMILLGGIGLPGGAVWVRRGAIRTKALRSAMSLAGPATNLLVAIAAAVAVKAMGDSDVLLKSALSYLGLLQITAVLLNLLPIPGLDGFGAIEPWLSGPTMEKLAPVGQYGFFVVFALFWYVPAFNEAFFDAAFGLFETVGGERTLAIVGDVLFRFWK